MDQGRIDMARVAQPAGMERRTVLMGIGAGASAALLSMVGPTVGRGAAQDATPGARGKSFVVIRRYRLAPDAAIADVVQRTEEGFVPIIRQVPGFVAYLNVDLGDGEGATISIFSSEASAVESTERAAAWASEHLSEFVQGPPEVMQGPVVIHVTAE